MKKSIKSALIIGALTVQTAASAGALSPREFYEETIRINEMYKVQPADGISMVIGSNELRLGEVVRIIDTAPKIINDRTYIPVRAVSDLFEAEVLYDAESRSITIITDVMRAEFSVGSENMQISFLQGEYPGYEVKLSAAAIVDENGRCQIPAANIAGDVFGCNAKWDGETRTVTLTRDYISRRLMVKTAGEYDFSKYEAAEHICNDKNLHILQFDLNTPEAFIKKCCDELNCDELIMFAEPDGTVNVEIK